MKQITLWGPSSSGKTALLSLLYLRSQATETGWNIYPTRESLPEIQSQSSLISKRNEFPAGTRTTDERELSYDFRARGSSEVFRLQTKDRAGSRSETLDADILTSLVAADGVVLLLDYGRGHRETEVINALSAMYVERVSRGGRTTESDPRPMAVCLSKVDNLVSSPADLKRIEEAPEEFVREHVSEELQRWIGMYQSRARYFPVSSVGVRSSYGLVRKSVFFDERLATRVTSLGTPINLVEPFVWLFTELRERA